jgi:hypothetical protein
MRVFSLNHDNATSYRLGHTPFSLKSPPHLHYKDAPICPSTASQGAKTLWIHPIWMWDAVNGGLKPQPHHNIIQDWPHPIIPKSHPHLHMYYSIWMHPYAHPQHLRVLKLFAHASNMDVGCSEWGFAASTMTLQHHTSSAIHHSPKSPHLHM